MTSGFAYTAYKSIVSYLLPVQLRVTRVIDDDVIPFMGIDYKTWMIKIVLLLALHQMSDMRHSCRGNLTKH